MFKWGLRKTEKPHDAVERLEGNLPRHVAIIMDGNGRWAERRGLPRFVGHRAGMKTVREIIRAAREIGIEVLTCTPFPRRTGNARARKWISSCGCPRNIC